MPATYLSIQNLFSSDLQSKNMNTNKEMSNLVSCFDVGVKLGLSH
jgi:hypothetical protein